MQKRTSMNNEDHCRDILVPSSDVISTVGASSSPDLELLESCPVALASAPEEWSCLTDLLPRSVNAELEVSDTNVPQGNAHLQIHYCSNAHAPLSDGDIGWRKIGKIRVSRKEIAKGSNGTIVLEGRYEDRPVAVKRLVRAHCDVASNEIRILMASDLHKNIVRYYGVEYDLDFVYLALERCACSLDDLIQVHSDSSNNSAFAGDPASMDDYKIKLDSVRGMMQDVNLWRADGYPSPLLRKLMRNVVSGLSHLHDLRIIHRDVKPQNVLITMNPTFCAQLSDMGISKPLPKDKSSLGYHATDVCLAGCGTSGWRAPELLRHGGRQTRAMDVFSLGCVLCFFFTRGRHPFGEILECDHNIVYNKMDLSFVDIPEAHDLFSCLLNQDPKLRPKASEVLHHPFFWSSKTRLSFLSDVSNKVEFETRAGNLDLLNALESTAQSVFVGNWEDKIEPAVRAELWRRRHYDGSLVKHLLRAVRNVYSHHMEFPEEVKEILGPVDDGLDAYFAIRFPRLLIESYKVVSQICKELLAGVLSK
ncbi:serine/threonine-protein kinase/endoribonuclease IRE1a isoform X2 [Eucalyptus grandis]|uniref:serine/threonine-protein kinase/endoribonuclease IRE1a isoform X2 n=1 Tax=Eucalyptus grandis TaxID=71139 RepID=UPI00192EB43A|nr:serine/threonine-protein kinase/endoribonuclease IRE1a isoform X2 [Eucalyptus grandis]